MGQTDVMALDADGGRLSLAADGVTPVLVIALAVAASAPGQARRTLRGWLVTSRKCATEIMDTADLLVSEVVSNAIRHTESATVPMTLSWRGSRMRVGVEDTHSRLVGPPVPSPPSESGGGGRGLWLIDQLADAWGSERIRTTGKTVWFELDCSRDD